MKNVKLKAGLGCLGILCLGFVAIVCYAYYIREVHSIDNYVKTTQSGIKILPWPKEMEKLYGDGDHFITEFGFSSGPRKWNTEVFFNGKYTLSMRVDVTVSYWRHTIGECVSPPKFYLHEVESVDLSTGRTEFSDQWELDEKQWSKLVQAKGDWSVLNIPVKTNQPVPGFDEYVKWIREPRVRIPH